MSNKPTNKEQARRLEYAADALIQAGFDPEQSAYRMVADDLVQQFGITMRTALTIEAKAARILRGESVPVHSPGGGRPRVNFKLRDGEDVNVTVDLYGDGPEVRRYRAELDGDCLRLVHPADESYQDIVVEKESRL